MEKEEKAVVQTDEKPVEEKTEPTAEVKEEAQVEAKKEAPPSDYVPLSKYMEERKRRQQLERERELDKAERAKGEIAKRFLDMGYSEEQAKAEAEDRYAQQRRVDEVEKRLALAEIRDLSKQGSLYAGADKYTDEIYQAMKQYGIDARKAYFLVCDPDNIAATLKEEQTQQEQRNLLKRREAEEKKVETAAPEKTETRWKLDDDDRKALRELQRAQPDKGWTEEEYAKVMGRMKG